MMITPKPKILNRFETANCLTRVKAKILAKWEEQARKKVPAAKNESQLALRDSLPQFLDQMVKMLASADPKAQTDRSSEVAHEHAEGRSKSPKYSLDQVIYEYSILRSVIIESLESEGIVELQSLNVIHELIDKSIRQGAVRYTEIETNRQADLTEIKADKEVAERSSEAKSSFLANMSHEIRTPLGAIMGFIGLLQGPGLPQKESSNYLSIIDRNAHHLLRIIDDILDLAKVESGKMTIEKVEFSMVEFLADFSSIISFKAREKGIAFEFKAESLLPELMISDPTRLRQILSNVVGNAIKFTEKGRVELTVMFDDHQLKFRVKDTGRGISPEQRPLLFQAFSQADSTTTRIFGGTGLGLVLTKKLCQALGGDFNLVESEIGKGSTFEVNIPFASRAEAKLVPLKNIEIAKIAGPDTDNRQIDLKDLKILLVEDSPDNQMLVQMILTKTGAKISLANDGLEGVASALAHHYDVILMDIQMPNLDGHEAVRTLRSKGYIGPVVALTAHAMKEERERVFQSGFSHFLSKPIDRKGLIDLLEVIHAKARAL
jgi:signal transduction histidine kinase/ActR/RegA family two-component response regulator